MRDLQGVDPPPGPAPGGKPRWAGPHFPQLQRIPRLLARRPRPDMVLRRPMSVLPLLDSDPGAAKADESLGRVAAPNAEDGIAHLMVLGLQTESVSHTTNSVARQTDWAMTSGSGLSTRHDLTSPLTALPDCRFLRRRRDHC